MKKKLQILYFAVYAVIMIIALSFLFSNKELLKTIGCYLGLAGALSLLIYHLTRYIIEKRNKKQGNKEAEQDKINNNDD